MSKLKKLFREENSAGFTIIELMVSMILLSVVSYGFLAATNSIYKGVHKQQGVANAADGNRRVLAILDKQLRYASAINTPVVNGGNFYLEYLWTKSGLGATVDQPTCMQWKLNNTTDVLQWRSWLSGATGYTATNYPAWNTADTGVVNDPVASPPFTLLPPSAGAIVFQYQRLQVNIISKRDTGNVTTTSTYTALNSSSSAVLTTPVCQEVSETWGS